MYETNVPAEEAEAREDARIFEAFRKHERQARTFAASSERARASLRITMKGIRLKRADLSASQPVSKRVHGTFFSLSVAPLPPGRQTAFTCAVSKGLARSAVSRNLIKRRCRESVSARLQTFATKRPLALVFHARRPAINATFAEIDRDVRSLIDKIAGTGYNLPQ